MSVITLLCFSIILIIAEIFFLSFFLLFIGIGLLITAGIEYFIGFSTFGNIYVGQSLSICICSLLSLILLKKPIKAWFANSQHYNDFLQNASGIGEMRNGMVYFKGTLWEYKLQDSKTLESKDNENSIHSITLNEGDKVKVIGISDNKVIIQY